MPRQALPPNRHATFYTVYPRIYRAPARPSSTQGVDISAEKVLVLNATGKVGRNVCRALLEAGFDVYGTTRSSNGPLKKGVVSFLSLQDCKYCATYDIGRAAAIQFRNPGEWLGKSLDVIGWQGDLRQVAAALSKVSGVPVKARLAMPIFLRRLFLNDLHHMFLYYEVHKGPRGTPEAFRKVVPDALTAEDWFRFHGRYANGERIAPRTTSG